MIGDARTQLFRLIKEAEREGKDDTERSKAKERIGTLWNRYRKALKGEGRFVKDRWITLVLGLIGAVPGTESGLVIADEAKAKEMLCLLGGLTDQEFDEAMEIIHYNSLGQYAEEMRKGVRGKLPDRTMIETALTKSHDLLTRFRTWQNKRGIK